MTEKDKGRGRYRVRKKGLLTVLFGSHRDRRSGGTFATLGPGRQPEVVQCVRVQAAQRVGLGVRNSSVRTSARWLMAYTDGREGRRILICD